MTDPTTPRPPAVWQTARIVDIKQRTERVRSYFLDPTDPRPWLSGQHVDVRLTAEDGYTAQRSYSIANVWRPAAPVELAIEMLRDGEVSGYFHKVAKVGDEVEIKLPLGYHFIWQQSDGPALLIGGGSGVVPLMSMARHHAERRVGADMTLLYSARRWQDVIFAEELTDRFDGRNGFTCHFALTRDAAPRGSDFSRRIDVEMVRQVTGGRPGVKQNVYICGSNGFVRAAETACLGAGIAPAALRTERYGE